MVFENGEFFSILCPVEKIETSFLHLAKCDVFKFAAKCFAKKF